MKKLTILFALLTLSVGLWAQEEPMPNEIWLKGPDQSTVEQFSWSDVVGSSDPNVFEDEGWIKVRFSSDITTLQSVLGPSFSDLNGLTEIYLPLSVTKIGNYAFANCSTLSYINIPASVTEIGNYAFYSCYQMDDVYVNWTSNLPIMGNNVFTDIAGTYGPSNATLHVPAGTKAIYTSANVWKDFGTIDTPTVVSYLSPVYNTDGVIKEWETKSVSATEITNASGTLKAGWYVVKGTNVQTGTLVCSGAVNLILADGAKLSTQGWTDEGLTHNNTPGIKVSGVGNSLTIYGQTAQTGQLIAKGATKTAGIGGGYNGQGSNITINGGIITAHGGEDAAGIGGGYLQSGSNITINGGTVTATGGNNAAGIGGGLAASGSNIAINGGGVIAIGGDNGAGIGGGNGYGGSGSDITIRDGMVIAISKDAAGIGGGETASGSNITILGGHVLTKGGIGRDGSAATAASNIKVAASLTVKNMTDSTIIAPDHTDETDIANDLAGKTDTIFINATTVSTTYMDENGTETNITAQDAFINMPSSVEIEIRQNQSNFTVNISPISWGVPNETTWYVVTDKACLLKGATYQGDVRLILADGAKLTAMGEEDNAGIQVSGEGGSLTIYGQVNQTGQLIATGGKNAAGIGGGNGDDGSNITINGGKVTANGGSFGAGIGGGLDANGSNITINGGHVSAKGRYGAGIGGGYKGGGSNIAINGGTVTAYSALGGAGIGSGYGSEVPAASDIYISDAYMLYAGANENNLQLITHSSATDLASTLTQKYVKIEGLANPYTRTMTTGNWATVCLPYAATSFSGADFYKVNHYDATENKLYIEPVTALEAGMPYIFEATEETVTINHDATAPIILEEEQTERGLHGSLARQVFTSDGNLAAISGGPVVIVDNGYTLTVPACRAYLDMSEVPGSVQPHSAPLRVMGVPRSTPTNNENVNADGNMNGKFIINGRLVIVKDGKKINALGF